MRKPLLALGLCLLALAPAAPAAAQVEAPSDTGGVVPPPATTPGSPAAPVPGESAPPPDTRLGGGSVPAVLDRGLAAGAISQADHDRYRADYDLAVSTRDNLPEDDPDDAACRRQLGSVIEDLERFARSGALTTSRMPALFLQLRRNTEFWASRPFVAAGQRVKFGDSELLFQHYAGEGVQQQPLANFGKANGLITECDTGKKCERAKLIKLLDELLPLRSRRGDFATWEYFFPFGGGSPPWASGLAQGTAIQALTRASVLLDRPEYRGIAASGLGLFAAAPPLGVRVPSGGGSHYLIYTFAPRLRVLNGFLQAVTGLYDYAKITGDPIGQLLFAAGNAAAMKEVPRYDTGRWSYYALPVKNQSSYGYHALVTRFLDNLCKRTGEAVYCRTAAKFTRYLAKRPQEPERPLPPRQRCGYLAPKEEAARQKRKRAGT